MPAYGNVALVMMAVVWGTLQRCIACLRPTLAGYDEIVLQLVSKGAILDSLTVTGYVHSACQHTMQEISQ